MVEPEQRLISKCDLRNQYDSLFSHGDHLLDDSKVHFRLAASGNTMKQETADEAYKKGVEMTMTQFLEALNALGVTPIEAVGQKFDPNEHNAVMHMEDPDKGEGEIVQEFQKGFKMGDRVIRFSMVQVAN